MLDMVDSRILSRLGTTENTKPLVIYPQTVMLGGFLPSIQYGHELQTRNLAQSFIIGEWDCDV